MFVAGRVIHTLVQTLTDNVPLRGQVFMINFLAVVVLAGHVALLAFAGIGLLAGHRPAICARVLLRGHAPRRAGGSRPLVFSRTTAARAHAGTGRA